MIMSIEATRPVPLAPAPTRIFPMRAIAELGKRIGGMLRWRSLRTSRNWCEYASDRLLHDIGLDRDEVRSAMSYLEEAHAKARSSLLP